jgi:hypothetical protein
MFGVEDKNDSSMSVNFVGIYLPMIFPFRGSNLSGEKGHGIAICGQVPKEVEEAA